MTAPPDPTVCPNCGLPGDHVAKFKGENAGFFTCQVRPNVPSIYQPKPGAPSPAAIICPNCLKPGNHWQRPTAVGQPGKYSCAAAAETPTPRTDAAVQYLPTPPGGEPQPFVDAVTVAGIEEELTAATAEVARLREDLNIASQWSSTWKGQYESAKNDLATANATIAELRDASATAADRLEWAIRVFEAHGDTIKLPWDRADEWVPYAKKAVEDIRKAPRLNIGNELAELTTLRETVARLERELSDIRGVVRWLPYCVEENATVQVVGELYKDFQAEKAHTTNLILQLAAVTRERDEANQHLNGCSKHKRWTGTWCIGCLEEEMLAARAECEQAKKERDALKAELAMIANCRGHEEAAAFEDRTTIDRLCAALVEARSKIDACRIAVSDIFMLSDGHASAQEAVTSVEAALATIDSALAGQPAVSPQLLAALNELGGFNNTSGGGLITDCARAILRLQNISIPVAWDGSRFVAGGQAE